MGHIFVANDLTPEGKAEVKGEETQNKRENEILTLAKENLTMPHQIR